MTNKTGREQREEAEIDREIYFTGNYQRKEQLHVMAEQIYRVYRAKPIRVLEIGKGNGFVSDYLVKSGLNVTTFDINEKLQPDVVGSILDLQSYFEGSNFDMIVCAEVLEHLPLENLEQCLRNIAELSTGNVLLTLPSAHKTIIDIQLDLKIPRIRRKYFDFGCTLPNSEIYEGHHWEVGSEPKSSKKNLEALIRKFFAIQEFKRVRENPYHYFIELTKK